MFIQLILIHIDLIGSIIKKKKLILIKLTQSYV